MTIYARSTARRDRHRKIISRRETHCGICEQEIDYSLPYLDDWSFVVDHIVPINRGGDDTLDNKQAAHRKCNRDKSDKLDGERMPRPEPELVSVGCRYETWRTW